MSKNMMIRWIIKAIHKVKPSIRDAQMNPEKHEEYDKWMEIIHWLESLRDQENKMFECISKHKKLIIISGLVIVASLIVTHRVKIIIILGQLVKNTWIIVEYYNS